MDASSDELEASSDSFSAAKDGDAGSSPSPLSINKRSANKYLFAVVKTPPFASAPRIKSCNGRFQRRGGSTNQPVFSCKRGIRLPIAFCATNKRTIRKQVIFSVCKVPNFAYQLHEATCHLRFQRRARSFNRSLCTCTRVRRCPISLSATNK